MWSEGASVAASSHERRRKLVHVTYDDDRAERCPAIAFDEWMASSGSRRAMIRCGRRPHRPRGLGDPPAGGWGGRPADEGVAPRDGPAHVPKSRQFSGSWITLTERGRVAEKGWVVRCCVATKLVLLVRPFALEAGAMLTLRC